jgi:hypothetical protein
MQRSLCCSVTNCNKTNAALKTARLARCALSRAHTHTTCSGALGPSCPRTRVRTHTQRFFVHFTSPNAVITPTITHTLDTHTTKQARTDVISSTKTQNDNFFFSHFNVFRSLVSTLLKPLVFVSILGSPLPPHNPVYTRILGPSVLAFRLSLHRHPYICIPCSSHYISYHKNKTLFVG